MIHLPQSVASWPSTDFSAALKAELEAVPVEQLPLQQGLQRSNYVLDDRPTVLVMTATDAGTLIQVRIGVFYSGIIAGCSCADDPTPVEPVSEYSELDVALDKHTAMATVTLA